MRLLEVAILSAGFTAAAAYGQSVLSVHSGVVHYVLGNVWIEDKPVELKFGHFPEVKPNETLRTEDGRAEMLLSPGSFLRVGENSAVRMTSNQLTDTRFELLKGEILVETVDFTKDSAAAKVKGNVITVAYKNTTTILEKPGLYLLRAEPGVVEVYEGEALVKADSQSLTLKRGRKTQLESVLLSEKFDARNGDELTRWSARRSSELAVANVVSARTMMNNSDAWTNYSGSYMGGWAFNPAFGMYTFVPMGGMAFSPFGYGFFSPYAAYQFNPYAYYGGSGFGYYGGGYGYYGGGSYGVPSGSRTGNTSGNVGGNSAIRGATAAAGHSRGLSAGGFSQASSGSSSGGSRGVTSSDTGYYGSSATRGGTSLPAGGVTSGGVSGGGTHAAAATPSGGARGR